MRKESLSGIISRCGLVQGVAAHPPGFAVRGVACGQVFQALDKRGNV
jgi:hypothetical protein